MNAETIKTLTVAAVLVCAPALPAHGEKSGSLFAPEGFPALEAAGQFALGAASSAATGVIMGYAAGRAGGLRETLRAHPRDLTAAASHGSRAGQALWAGHTFGAVYGAYDGVIRSANAPSTGTKFATAAGAALAGGLASFLAHTAVTSDSGVRLNPALAAVWVASAAGATIAHRATRGAAPSAAIAQTPKRVELDVPVLAYSPAGGEISAQVLRAKF